MCILIPTSTLLIDCFVALKRTAMIPLVSHRRDLQPDLQSGDDTPHHPPPSSKMKNSFSHSSQGALSLALPLSRLSRKMHAGWLFTALLAVAVVTGVADARRARVQAAVGNCPQPVEPVPLPASGTLPEDIQLALEDINDLFQSVISDPSLSEAERATLAFAGCVTLNDRVLQCSYMNGSGIAQPGPDTIFHIASVTKTFTALAAFHLAERGVMALDDPIAKFIPEFSVQNPFNFVQGPVTVRQALSFVSGLPRATPCVFGCNVSASEMLARISQLSVGVPQWSAPRYSNLGISLVGHAIEAATGIPFEQYVQDNILSVLNMTSTGMRHTPEVLARMILGFNEDAPGVPVPIIDFGAGWDAPAGGMFSTAEDLAKYAIALNGQSPRKLFLSDATLSEFLQTTYPNADASTGFGMTWESLFFTDGSRLVTKSGSMPGYMSEVSVVPGRNIGIVSLINYFSNDISTTTTNIEALGMILPAVDTYFLANPAPLPTVPDIGVFAGNYSQLSSAMISVAVELAQLPGSPDGVLGYFVGGKPVGYLARAPVDTHVGLESFWFRYTAPGEMPCFATELGAMDAMEFLFYFPNTTTTTAPLPLNKHQQQQPQAAGFYVGDMYSQSPYERV